MPRLSDTAAIASKRVVATANPDVSGFQARKASVFSPNARPARDTNAGFERPTAAMTKRLDQC